MSELERESIIDALKELPETDKQFMLGYAAGRSASVNEEQSSSESTKAQSNIKKH